MIKSLRTRMTLWILLALGSASFAALVAVFGKLGVLRM